MRNLLLTSLLPAVLVLPASAQAPDESTDQVGLSREVLKQYYKTQELIAKEKTDWALAEEILGDRIDLIRSQITELEEKTKNEEAKITEADKEREKLRADLDDLKVVETLQAERLVGLETRVQDLLERLPAPLQDKIIPLVERLPERGTPQEDIKLSIAQRYQNVLGILNEVNKFHADVIITQERRTIEGDREAEVSSLYFGLGQALYAGSGETAEEAGVGFPGPAGFEWDRRAFAAEEIGLLIKIYNGETVAKYVPVSVTIK